MSLVSPSTMSGHELGSKCLSLLSHVTSPKQCSFCISFFFSPQDRVSLCSLGWTSSQMLLLSFPSAEIGGTSHFTWHNSRVFECFYCCFDMGSHYTVTG